MRDRNDGGGRGASLRERMAGALKEAPLTCAQRQSLRERVLAAAAADTAPTLTQTVRGHSLPWQRAWDGVWVQVLRRDTKLDLQVTLLRMEPGGRVAGHVHAKDEECVVLDGEVLIGSHRLLRGDFHLAHAGSVHPEITSPGGALLLVRSEIPAFT